MRNRLFDIRRDIHEYDFQIAGLGLHVAGLGHGLAADGWRRANPGIGRCSGLRPDHHKKASSVIQEKVLKPVALLGRNRNPSPKHRLRRLACVAHMAILKGRLFYDLVLRFAQAWQKIVKFGGPLDDFEARACHGSFSIGCVATPMVAADGSGVTMPAPAAASDPAPTPSDPPSEADGFITVHPDVHAPRRDEAPSHPACSLCDGPGAHPRTVSLMDIPDLAAGDLPGGAAHMWTLTLCPACEGYLAHLISDLLGTRARVVA